MTDERIKEEFKRWGYNSETTSMEEGFYAGFRAAERLAKIEVLNKVLADPFITGYMGIDAEEKIDAMIDELKKAN